MMFTIPAKNNLGDDVIECQNRQQATLRAMALVDW